MKPEMNEVSPFLLHARWRRISFAFGHMAVWPLCYIQKGSISVLRFAEEFLNMQLVTL